MAFLPYPGHHVAAWRHFNTPSDGGLDFSYYTSLAKTTKRGKLDSFFYRMAQAQTSVQPAILGLSPRKSLPRTQSANPTASMMKSNSNERHE
jgi:hypothetical protein